MPQKIKAAGGAAFIYGRVLEWCHVKCTDQRWSALLSAHVRGYVGGIGLVRGGAVLNCGGTQYDSRRDYKNNKSEKSKINYHKITSL